MILNRLQASFLPFFVNRVFGLLSLRWTHEVVVVQCVYHVKAPFGLTVFHFYDLGSVGAFVGVGSEVSEFPQSV